MTYVVLVILIALWAMVLLPPYLKDRRSGGRAYGSRTRSTSMSSLAIPSPTSSSAQRFLPLQQASTGYATHAVSSPTGIRTSGIAPLTANQAVASPPLGSNVVPLRPLDADAVPSAPNPEPARPLATSAAAYLEDAPHQGGLLTDSTWSGSADAGLGMPVSTAAARERRRHVLLGLTGVAFFTLILALFGGGGWIAIHVLVDVVLVGYVILLVRHRQLAADRMMKVEPIRPPVNEQPPVMVQAAPSYLVRSNTGS